MSFHVSNVTAIAQPLTLTTFAASQPGVAQLRYSNHNDEAEVRGMIVFASLREFLAWRDAEMSNFFEVFGQNIDVKSLRVVRPEEVAKTGSSDLSQIADDINIHYANTGNDSEGDADIDAVTVICGDGAQCDPSN